MKWSLKESDEIKGDIEGGGVTTYELWGGGNHAPNIVGVYGANAIVSLGLFRSKIFLRILFFNQMISAENIF
jgi:hypothetical protein